MFVVCSVFAGTSRTGYTTTGHIVAGTLAQVQEALQYNVTEAVTWVQTAPQAWCARNAKGSIRAQAHINLPSLPMVYHLGAKQS